MKEIRPGFYRFSLGSPMNVIVWIVGVIMQLMGLYSIFDSPFVGVLIFLLGCLATYQWQGVEVNVQKQMFRSYSSIVGVKTGKWIQLETFPFIAVIKRSTVQRVYGQSMAGYDHHKEFYSIVLLNKTHRVKYVLANEEGIEVAKLTANKIASTLDREIVKYSPELSQSSRTRKRR